MEDFDVRFLKKEEYQDWDRFVDESPYGTIFHKSYWYAEMLKLDPGVELSVIACYKNSALVGGYICGSKRKYGLQISIAPDASSYFGILIKERDTNFAIKAESFRHSILTSILEFAEQHFKLINTAFVPEFRDIRTFNWRKYSSRVFYTYRGDISKPDKAFNEFLPDIRRRIKKGEEYDFEVKESIDQEHLEDVFSLLKKSFERQKHQFKFSRKFFLEILKDSELSSKFRTYSIWLDEKPVASLVIIVDGDTGYYWLAGGDHEYFKTGLNQVLLWKVISQLSESGIKYFDMVGANTLTISNYKASMNFELHPYYLVSKTNGRLARTLFSIKNLLQSSSA